MKDVDRKRSVIKGSVVANADVVVEVQVDEDCIQEVVEALTDSLMLRVENIDRTLTRDDIVRGFAFALHMVLSQDSGARPGNDPVPLFLMDLVMPIRTVDGTIHLEVAEPWMPGRRPDSYRRFLNTLAVYGINSGKMPSVNPGEFGRVLAIGFEDFRGVNAVFSNASDITLEEVLVRYMLQLTDDSEEAVARAIGHLDYHYGDAQDLVRSWATANPVVCV